MALFFQCDFTNIIYKICAIFSLVIFYLHLGYSCDLNSPAYLQSAGNISTVVGHNVLFICCGGNKWTYESDTGFAGREIGEHPVSSGPNDLKSDSFMFESDSKYSPKSKHVATTVYKMRDDRGRLILRIDNASLGDSGYYRCNGKSNHVDVFLSVHPPEHFPIDKHTGLPILPSAASMIKRFVMFSSFDSQKVSSYAHCA